MASTYLSRTPGNNYYLKATFSFWFKRHGLGEMGLFGRKGSNNTAETIDRNQLVGQIFIQPTRTAEFIVLDFVVQPTGAAFPE